ncbi:MAG TPA: segregation/condensation protein A [Gammaproteobacteria bacterium]|nr:segregation/condensation protein A [Gammaproteobacteria bacterium]
MSEDAVQVRDRGDLQSGARAKVAGKALEQWPADLYIPPEALEVVLESFEGPLDLLLYLIRKQNIDILDLPIADITRQYVHYIDLMQRMRLDLAADYLVMATMLAEIKSRMLLPRPDPENDDEEDPRAALIKRLQEYERFKSAAENLDNRPRLERDLYLVFARVEDPDPPKIETRVELDDLVAAMRSAMLSAARRQHLQIVPETLSVRERMGQILDRVRSGEYVALGDFFTSEEGRKGLVVSFIAILELVRDGILTVAQNEAFSQIHVKVKST